MIQYILPRQTRKQIASDIVDDISMDVQRWGGEFVITRYGIEFYIPEEYTLWMGLLYPFLKQRVI